MADYPCYINGEFSIGEYQQVYFSQGNLQYQASTNTWRFAENQWDYVGTEIPDANGYVGGTVPGSSNHLISADYDGWIDLFAWGTGNRPVFMGYSSVFVDWGINPISNAGGQAYPWRTLTDEEWDYLLFERQTSSGICFAFATVNDVRGLILLPDDWDASIYHLNNVNIVDHSSAGFTSNVLTISIWKDVFEAYGAVFLPCAGKRNIYDVWSVGRVGSYWTAKCGSFINFGNHIVGGNDGLIQNEIDYINRGLSVRLVWCKQAAFK